MFSFHPQIVTPKNKLRCSYCYEEFDPGDRLIKRFRGVSGFSGIDGESYPIEDPNAPEETLLLHEECELPFLTEGREDNELLRFCAGCGAKITDDEDD